MIPADEHDYTVDASGPPGVWHVRLDCRTCNADDPARLLHPFIFWGQTLGFAVKAHRQHVAATDLAQNGRSTC